MRLQKSSVIWKIPKEDLTRIVLESQSFKEILKKINLLSKGGNNNTLRRRLDYEGINYLHIYENIYKARGGVVRKSNEEVFIQESTQSRTDIKKRILKQNLIPEICQICKNPPMWLNKKLVLILDHINGISNDHRLENLRFVCPNCNSQLDTHCGKHLPYFATKYKETMETFKLRRLKHICKLCGIPISRTKNNLCWDCYQQNLIKTNRPTLKELIFKMKELRWNFLKGSKFFKVSDNAIRKWFRYYAVMYYDYFVDPYGDLFEIE